MAKDRKINEAVVIIVNASISNSHKASVGWQNDKDVE